MAFHNTKEKVIVTKNIAETITEDFNPLFAELNLHPQGDREERLSPDQAAQRYPGVVPGPRLILLGWILAIVLMIGLIVLYILYKIHLLG